MGEPPDSSLGVPLGAHSATRWQRSLASAYEVEMTIHTAMKWSTLAMMTTT